MYDRMHIKSEKKETFFLLLLLYCLRIFRFDRQSKLTRNFRSNIFTALLLSSIYTIINYVECSGGDERVLPHISGRST